MPQQAKPDFTAWFVMQGIIATMEHPAFQDTKDAKSLALYKPLSDAARNLRLVTRITTSLPYSWQHAIHELVTNQGRLKFFCFRKKEIEKQTRQLLQEEGVTQVIVLGAGLDVLSLKLAPEYSHIKFIEIDREESQNFKRQAFDSAHTKFPKNIEYLAADLQNPLAQILGTSKFHDPKSKTLWIAEGFLMFIPEDSVIRIFREMRENSSIGSYAIFTTIPHPYPGNPFAQWIQKCYMRKEKCPYAWTISMEAINEFIRKQHYRLINQISYDKLQNYDRSDKKQENRILIEDIHIACSLDF